MIHSFLSTGSQVESPPGTQRGGRVVDSRSENGILTERFTDGIFVGVTVSGGTHVDTVTPVGKRKSKAIMTLSVHVIPGSFITS